MNNEHSGGVVVSPTERSKKWNYFFKSLDKRLEKLEKRDRGVREGEDEKFFHKA